MQTIFKVEVDDSKKENELKILLELGARITHVTPIQGSRRVYGQKEVEVPYTQSILYILEEPDTEEYKTNKEKRFKELDQQITNTRRYYYPQEML